MIFPSRSSKKKEGFADLPDIWLIMFHHLWQSSFFRYFTLLLKKDFFLFAISCWILYFKEHQTGMLPLWNAFCQSLIISLSSGVIHGLSVPCSLMVFTGRIRSMASINWVINEDTRSSTDGLGPRSVNQSCVVTHLPKASIPDRG